MTEISAKSKRGRPKKPVEPVVRVIQEISFQNTRAAIDALSFHYNEAQTFLWLLGDRSALNGRAEHQTLSLAMDLTASYTKVLNRAREITRWCNSVDSAYYFPSVTGYEEARHHGIERLKQAADDMTDLTSRITNAGSAAITALETIERFANK